MKTVYVFDNTSMLFDEHSVDILQDKSKGQIMALCWSSKKVNWLARAIDQKFN